MASAVEAPATRFQKVCRAIGRFFLALWAGFKGLATPIAAVSAFLASLTALGVYEGEERRNKFERMRHSYESYRDFTTSTASRPTILPCVEALVELEDNDLLTLLKYDRELKFNFVPSRHAALAACLRRDDQDEDPPVPEKWTLAQSRLVRAKIIARIDSLDTVLISYTRDVGDPGFVCENVVGIFDVGNGVIGRFFEKMIRVDLIRERNYPNIRKFAIDYSTRFAKGESCPKPLDLQSARNKFLDRYKDLLNWLAEKIG